MIIRVPLRYNRPPFKGSFNGSFKGDYKGSFEGTMGFFNRAPFKGDHGVL